MWAEGRERAEARPDTGSDGTGNRHRRQEGVRGGRQCDIVRGRVMHAATRKEPQEPGWEKCGRGKE